MDSGTITGLAFVFFLAGALIYTVILYNGLVRLRNENDRAWPISTCCSSSATTRSPTWLRPSRDTCSTSSRHCWR